ncbi:MAG: acyl-CoA dehydrogenase [bacterium]|nr:acyl-CoA dehydrogenase [bacterium]
MDYELPEDVVMLRDMARKFAADKIGPNAREWDRTGEIPGEIIKELGELGFLGMRVPPEYGGAGLGYLAVSAIIEELACHCGGTALMVAAQNGLGGGHLMVGGNEAQKKKYLPLLAKGELFGSWCLSEPSSGSDAAALKTTAVLDGDTWVLNGSKVFVTNGARAGIFLIHARTDPEAPKAKGISTFIVERDAPGLEISPKEDKMGMRASDTVQLTLDDVRVPQENLVGELNRGFYDVMTVLEGGRITIGALSVGLGRGAFEQATQYATEREQFGKPLAKHQAIQFKLADMAVQVDAARLLVRKAAMLQDAGRSSNLESAMAKLYASEMATRVCLEAIQIHGGYGYLKDMPVERLMRDAKLCEIGEGSSEIQRMVIARRLLDLPR